MRRESAEADRELLRTIREETTEADRHAEWARWRRAARRSDGGGSPWIRGVAELWSALTVARVPQRAALVAVVLLIATLGWWQFRPDLVEFRTPAASLGAGGLPATLRLSLQQGRASLEASGPPWTALLDSPRRGAGLTSYEVDWSGTNAAGLRVIFKGTLIATNRAGVTLLNRAAEIAGVELFGDLTIGSQAPVQYRQSYLP